MSPLQLGRWDGARPQPQSQAGVWARARTRWGGAGLCQLVRRQVDTVMPGAAAPGKLLGIRPNLYTEFRTRSRIIHREARTRRSSLGLPNTKALFGITHGGRQRKPFLTLCYPHFLSMLKTEPLVGDVFKAAISRLLQLPSWVRTACEQCRSSVQSTPPSVHFATVFL